MINDKMIWELSDHFWAARYRLSNEVIMDKDEGLFYGYDSSSGLWSPITDENLAANVLRHTLTLGRRQVGFDGNGMRRAKKISGIVSSLSFEAAKTNPWQKRPGLIHLQNGMIDLNEERIKLKPFGPSYYSRNKIPWCFAPGAECDRFFTELLGPALSDDDCELVQRIAGSLLMGVNLTQRIFIFTGTPGGGKSTLIQVLQMLIGQSNVASLRPALLNHRFEMQGFIGKTCLSAADVPGNFLSHESTAVLKSLTGGDFLQAELKRSGLRVPMMGNFNITITANSRLKMNIKDDADTWKRRIVIVSYQRKKPKNPVGNFAEKLMLGDSRLGWKPEASGILNWAISGAQKLLNDSSCGKGFTLNSAQNDRIELLINEGESVRYFIERKVERHDQSDATNRELIEAYHAYCSDNGWDAVCDYSFNSLAREYILRSHRVAPCHCVKRTENGKTSNKRGYKNIRCLNVGPR